MEQWKDIEGFEGIYMVSNLGRVKSLDRLIEYLNGKIQSIAGRIMKYNIDRYGYYKIILTDFMHHNKTFTIHRLVAAAFLANPDKKLTVNHINGIKTDNRIENLEWATVSENTLHAHRVLKIKANAPWLGKSGFQNPKSKTVVCINTKEIYGSVAEAERNLKVSHVSAVCNGKRNHTGGLKFKYA